jgi:hypothetical protein
MRYVVISIYKIVMVTFIYAEGFRETERLHTIYHVNCISFRTSEAETPMKFQWLLVENISAQHSALSPVESSKLIGVGKQRFSVTEINL